MQMDAGELTEWMAFENVNGPLDDVRGDYRAGLIASTNLAPWTSSDKEKLGPWDMIPDWGGQRARLKEQMKDEQKRKETERLRLYAESIGQDGEDEDWEAE